MTALLNLATVYRTAVDRAPDEDAEVPWEGAVSVLQFDAAVAQAVEDLGRALAAGNLTTARAAERGLRAVSEAFGSAEWMIQRRQIQPD